MSVFNVVGKLFSGTGKVAGEMYKFLKLLVILAICISIAFIAYLAYNGIGTLLSPFRWFSGPTVPMNLPEKVSEERLICRAYAMLADFKGAPSRLDADKVRVLRTIAAYHRIVGVDECEIFRRQMELVVPGAIKRSMFYRREWYVSSEFPKPEQDQALLLAREVADHPDLSWEAIVLIRPRRSGTVANQTDAEIQAIEDTMVPVKVDGPSDFKFFKLRSQKE